MTMLLKASTNVVRYFMMRKVSDGTAFTGATITTFDLQYTRELTAAAVKIDAIVGTGGATTHVDNKVFEVEATDSPGLYMVCFPDAAFATGVDQVTLNVTYDATVFTEAQNIQLVAFDPFDVVRMGMTALPNAAADAAGGLPISDAGGLDLDDIPITSEFEARTLVAASYFDPAADAVANVTLVATTTVATDAEADIAALNNISTADVNTQADLALSDIHLDHLMAAAAADVVVDGSVIAHMVSATEDWSTFVPSTDSLQAIRDRGDAAWTTGAGGSDRLLMVDTTIATLASQVSFTLTAGSADDGAYEGCTVIVEDVSTATQKAIGICDVYTGATKTVTLLEDPGVFTMAATDKVYVLAEKGIKPTVSANYHIDLSSGGTPGVDWANVDNPTTAVDLSGTDIQLVDTTTTNSDMRGTDSAGTAAELAKVPKSDGTTSWNATALAAIESEANDALVAQKLDHLVAVADADDPVDGSIMASLVSTTADWSTFVEGTDALQAIRDRGDAAWTTGAGGSDRLLMVDTTIATLASQVSFTLTAGSADDGAYEGCTVIIEDVSTATQKAIGICDVYTGATKTVTLLEDPGVFTMAATDKIYILAEKGLKPTVSADYHLDLSAAGNAGIDWANVDSPTTAVDLSATDIQLVDTVTTLTNLPAITSNWLTAAGLAADAATEIADSLLARDIGSGSGAGSLDERTVRSALRFLRNKWDVSGGTLTVKKEDDSTTTWTSTITGDAAADPVIGSDPT